MGIKKVLRQSRTVVMVYEDVIDLWSRVKRRRQRRDIDAYLAGHDVHSLQVGAGPTVSPGWLCTDIMPARRGTAYLDATRPFPIGDRQFEYVYSEHMIEHIPYDRGAAMLAECFRILKPGGRIRIATPDLARLLELYPNAQTEEGRHYVEWVAANILKDRAQSQPIFVINNAFRAWGHQFLYDEATLGATLRAAGFDGVRRCRPGESETERFRGLERHGQNIGDEGVNQYETLVLEAERPA